jgi:osmotically inducible protein OsmC
MPNILEKVVYTAKAHTTGGREGRSTTDDGLLDVRLSPPKAMGGAGNATNPEQLFAAGYQARRRHEKDRRARRCVH